MWGDSVDYAFTIEGATTNTPDESIVIINESLTGGLGIFRDVKPDGTQGTLWRSDSKYGAVANAYNIGKIADNYLLADLNLTDCKSARLEFMHQTGYNAGVNVRDTYFNVLVTDDYSDSPQETSWESLYVDFPDPPTSNQGFHRMRLYIR